MERGSASAVAREVRRRHRVEQDPERRDRPLQRDAGIRRGLRNVAERECQLDTTSRVWSSDRAWRSRIEWWERPIASARGRPAHMPSRRRLRPTPRRGAERMDQPVGSRPATPRRHRRILENASSDRFTSEDGPGVPITTTDLSAVGQGTLDVELRNGMGGPSPSGGRHVRTSSSLPWAASSLEPVPGSGFSVLGALKGTRTSGGCSESDRPESAGRGTNR
jgi:hypothetical protein